VIPALPIPKRCIQKTVMNWFVMLGVRAWDVTCALGRQLLHHGTKFLFEIGIPLSRILNLHLVCTAFCMCTLLGGRLHAYNDPKK
jgi:hypothetical protein